MNNFIERSLLSTLSFIKGSVFADEYALKRGFLQTLDPRIRVTTLLLFLISILFTKNIPLILGMYLFSLSLAYLSRIKLGFFLKRTWIFMPLFSLFIALPLLFAAFSPGEVLFLGITRQGLMGGVLFVLRIVSSISFVILLSLVTRHTELLNVLRIFHIPVVFVMTIGMCYRYIYLFVEIIENTFLAIKSRIGGRIHYKKGQRIVAWNITNLWQRSYQLNQQVFQAMLSRGYSGEPKILDDFTTRPKDYAWLFFSLAVFALILYLNHG